MEIKRSSQELVSIYTRLKHTAETLDQSQLDNNRTEDYVNLTFKQVEPEKGQWGLHGTRQIHSHPETVTNHVVDGLISRKTEVQSSASRKLNTPRLRKAVPSVTRSSLPMTVAPSESPSR